MLTDKELQPNTMYCCVGISYEYIFKTGEEGRGMLCNCSFIRTSSAPKFSFHGHFSAHNCRLAEPDEAAWLEACIAKGCLVAKPNIELYPIFN